MFLLPPADRANAAAMDVLKNPSLHAPRAAAAGSHAAAQVKLAETGKVRPARRDGTRRILRNCCCCRAGPRDACCCAASGDALHHRWQAAAAAARYCHHQPTIALAID
jgi:hypothetical protein